ncbi:hypothetical protein C5O19_11350 [Siphonobacter curvatus]|uniref:Uncharacterized protein n=1 Tax=Siphonobacter curvatus TaxID=2094562 RepID=A0A2S7IR32_9BACT|nr:hypothetical protein C5O19_11350 [Siphonobacter curvatus]
MSVAQKTPNGDFETWYVLALEDSVIKYEKLKPLYYAQAAKSREAEKALLLSEKARGLELELYEIDRRKWEKAEADLRRQIRGLKLVGKLKGAGGVLIGAGVIILTIAK